MNWPEYAEACRALSDVRLREAERNAGVAERTGTGRTSLAQLRQRLDAQYEYLTGLAVRLREPKPAFDPAARAGLTDPDEAVRRGWEAVERADDRARQADQRALRPAFLPGASARVRNAVVYAGATLVAALLSAGLWELNPNGRAGHIPLSLLPWSLCGLPALAFFAGYFTIASFGRARIQQTEKPERSALLGGLICLFGLWLSLILIIAATH
jgi:hypothetical protein